MGADAAVVPGYPTYTQFQGAATPALPVTAIFSIPITGLTVVGDIVTFTLALNDVGQTPTIAYTTVSGDTTNTTLATHLAAAIQADITGAITPWSSRLTSAAASGTKINVVLKNDNDYSVVDINVAITPQGGSTLSLPAVNDPSTPTYRLITALQTFSFDGGGLGVSGVQTLYKGQQEVVPQYIALDLIAQGFVS